MLSIVLVSDTGNGSRIEVMIVEGMDDPDDDDEATTAAVETIVDDTKDAAEI